MAMTRRGFFGLLATGAVGACVAAKVPIGWLPEPVRRTAALDFLRSEYYKFAKGDGVTFPRRMTAGRELYEAAEGEFLAYERFIVYPVTAVPSILFKGARLECVGEGWRVECHEA